MNALFLAFAYIRYHLAKSLVLILVTALILFVPMATQILLLVSERQLTERADRTPLLAGRRGSALDLTMNALYFSDERPEPVAMALVDEIWDSGLATPIPVHTAFQSQGFRIVGTTLDYFKLRDLNVESGRQLAVLGDAVIGAEVARRLGKSVGDTLVSSPENLFDLDGVYPLEMPIVGILATINSPDDLAVFVDVKTAWVISGIGHGHEDVVTSSDAGNSEISAAPGIIQYNQITPENIDSFHFHGKPEDYPVSAVIVDPNDRRAATILRGRYLDPQGLVQMVVPGEIVQSLVDRMFRIKVVLDLVTLVIGAAALIAIALAMFLSYRLRASEMETAIKLGARRGMIFQLLVAETVILLSISLVIAIMLTLVVQIYAENWVGWLLALGT